MAKTKKGLSWKRVGGYTWSCSNRCFFWNSLLFTKIIIKLKGKRTGLYGSFLLACYNEELDRFETCCKTGTGFSDENLEKLY